MHPFPFCYAHISLFPFHHSLIPSFPFCRAYYITFPFTFPHFHATMYSFLHSHSVIQDKVKAARDLIHRLHSEKPSLVHAMEQLCEAYIDLAYHDVSTHRKERKPIKFPASCTLIKLAGQLKDVAVPTVDIEVVAHFSLAKTSLDKLKG